MSRLPMRPHVSGPSIVTVSLRDWTEKSSSSKDVKITITPSPAGLPASPPTEIDTIEAEKLRCLVLCYGIALPLERGDVRAW